jgi:hypothetical protein
MPAEIVVLVGDVGSDDARVVTGLRPVQPRVQFGQLPALTLTQCVDRC